MFPDRLANLEMRSTITSVLGIIATALRKSPLFSKFLSTRGAIAAALRNMPLCVGPSSESDRFCTWTESEFSESKMLAAVPPVDRWYQVKIVCMKSTLIMPKLHCKSWVHAATEGGSGVAIRPITACDWK